jgi:hypothetical protein
MHRYVYLSATLTLFCLDLAQETPAPEGALISSIIDDKNNRDYE